jgi:hypothetical protein
MKREKSNTKKFIATVDEDKMDAIQDIATHMKNEGVKVDQVLSMSGIITGKASSMEELDKFKSKGIKSIEEDREVKAI